MSKPNKASEIDVPKELLVDLMTESEIKMMKNRWKVVVLLSRGLSVRKVAEEVSVGTDTVVRMSKLLRVNSKVRQQAKGAKIEANKKSSEGSKWIFGQVGSEK